VFEVRGHYTNDEAGVRIGNMFFGSEGYMHSADGYKAHLGHEGKEAPPFEGDLPAVGGTGEGNHFENFTNAVRSRKPEDLDAPVLAGHYSSALCHMGNISYRLRRSLTFDPVTERFVGDAEANKLLTRKYRSPFVIPEKV
jgi:hypothetical protein